MGVAIDQARRNGMTSTIDRLGSSVMARNLAGRTHCHNHIAFHGNRAVGIYTVLLVHRNDKPVVENDIYFHIRILQGIAEEVLGIRDKK